MTALRRQWFLILLSLAERDRHGSGIMRDVLELTEGEVRLWPVTLYGSLEELCEHGWIRSIAEPSGGGVGGAASDESGVGGHRRWFRITAHGRRALASEVARMDGMLRVAERRLAHVTESP